MTRTSTGIGLRRANGPHFALLQHAQQLDLQRERHVADLVQEDRPAVGRLEQPLVRLHGARERAARVAEELGFEQRLRNRAAVDGDERLVAARAGAMMARASSSLPGAGIAVDQMLASESATSRACRRGPPSAGCA
jgi:hypothetical protein